MWSNCDDDDQDFQGPRMKSGEAIAGLEHGRVGRVGRVARGCVVMIMNCSTVQ
jgi:hypothetical protein